MSRRRLEICVDRLDSALAARDGGADRIEVCGALACGGTTPGAGLVSACLELSPLEVMVMIRPHAGPFVYSPLDLVVMEKEIAAARRAGANGVVFGALTLDHDVDRAACRRLLDVAGPLGATFHRAFDLTRDPLEALEALIELGFERVLTSGQASTALEGARLLECLVKQAAGRIVVMPGAGVSAANVANLLAMTNATELHASASEPIEPVGARGNRRWDFVFPARATTVARVRALRTAIDGIAPPD